ncbi:MAG: polysaccharide deacetylase family protein [Rhodospirillaceae bacterium]|nr:polysaccharide deacetylase family protein [Rhodospirillaceae bacterium]
MTLPKEYLEYPLRRYGMDQDFYAWSILFRRPKVKWPDGARVALWITTDLEFFPLDQPAKPFKAPGGMVTPYPDLRHFTTRDYGNRVGIQRIWRVLDKYKIRSSVAMNAKVAERVPYLVKTINARGDEIIAMGVDQGKLHYGGMDDATEAALVKDSVGVLRKLSGQPVVGWMSPAKSESWNTLKHLKANGIDYVCDWVADDMPFELNAPDSAGKLWAMPHSSEISDRKIIIDNKHSEDEFVEQIKDQFTGLYKESAKHGGRILSISLTPYIMGLHYRIKYLDQALGWLMKQKHVWPATGAQILAAFKGQG